MNDHNHICWCSTGLPADKWILVGGPLGYPAHIIWLPPHPGV